MLHSSVKRMVSIYDIPEDMLRSIVDVLQNDLREYESLDQDFGPGTEESIQKFISVVQPSTAENATNQPE